MFKTLQKKSISGRKAKILSGLLLFSGICLIVLIVITARVRDTNSDPYLSLLVSQSILKNHTIQLDDYYWNENFRRGHAISIKNDHAYDWHPLGTSIFSIPAVWVANWAGKDMLLFKDDSFVQIAIAAILLLLIFVLVFKIARCWLSPVQAFIISIVSLLGTSYANMATALWSFDFEILFLCLSFLFLAEYQTNKRISINPYLLGFFLFSAYFCRPSANIFIFLTFLYIFAFKRDIFFKTALTAGSLLLAFVFFSYHEYHQILPDYYLLGSELGFKTFWLGLYSNTFGPSRGIFIFSPFLLLVLAATIIYFKNLRKNPLFWFALAWFILHLITLSAFSGWWFGKSYGPRTFADAWLSVTILTIFVWLEISKSHAKIYRTAFFSSYFILASLALFINTRQGLYNKAVQWWQDILEMANNNNSKYILDWKHPQFLASEAQLRKMLDKFRIAQYGLFPNELQPYQFGEKISFNSKEAIFKNVIDGYSSRTFVGNIAAVIFHLNKLEKGVDYILQIKVNALFPVQIGVNGFIIGAIKPFEADAFFLIPKGMLIENYYNIIEFHWPGLQENQASEMTLFFRELRLDTTTLISSIDSRQMNSFRILPFYGRAPISKGIE